MLCKNKSKLLPNSYPGAFDCGENTLEKKKNVYSLDQSHIKKIALQENGKPRVQLNIPEIVIVGLIGYTQSYPT